MKNLTGFQAFLAVIGVIAVIFVLFNWDKIFGSKADEVAKLAKARSNGYDSASRTVVVKDSDNQDGDIKCELTDAYGRTITITGRGPEFERLCLERKQQYLYGYYWWPVNYYIWSRPWGWRHWGGGRNPSGGHGSGTGGGTGGGGGTGTGAGTGTPGTGTP